MSGESVAINDCEVAFSDCSKTLCIKVLPSISTRGLFLSRVDPILEGIKIIKSLVIFN